MALRTGATERSSPTVIEYARQQAALFQLADELHRAKSSAEVYEAALKAILSALQCKQAAILLFDRGGKMRFVAWHGLSEGYRKTVEGHSPWTPQEKNPEPIWINDIAAADLEGSLKATVEKEGIAALAFIPLVSNGKLIGKFMSYFNAPHIFTDQELDLALTIGRQLVFAIERKRADEALRESEAQLEAELADTKLLQSISGELISEENVEVLYERILDAAVAIMRSQYASMQMLYPERGSGGEVRLLAHRGFDAQAAKFCERVRADSASTSGLALRTGKRVVVTNVEECEFMGDTSEQAACLQAGIRAVQTTPLVSRSGRNLGMISTYWREPHEPSERDLRLLDILARQAADLIERKQADEALRNSKTRFDIVKDAAQVGFWFSDLPFNKLIWDKRAKEHSWLPPEADVTMDTFYERLHPDDRQRTRQAIEECISNKTGYDVEYRTVGPTGRQKWIRAIGHAFYDAYGKPIRFDGVTFDITPRKEAEQARARLAAIVEFCDDAIVSKDLNGVITSWNHGAERLFGYTAQEAIGQPVTMLIPPDRLDEEPRILERIRCGEPVKHFDTVRRHKNGTLLDISLTVSPIVDRGGRVVGVSKISRDITERKQAEAAVRESAERLRFMAESMPQKIFTAKPNGDVDYFNRQWTEFTGLTFDRIKDGGWTQFIHPDDLEENLRQWKYSIHSGEPFQFEHRFRRKDGVYRWHLTRAQAMRDEQGAVLMWIGSSTDIDDQKRAEERLEEIVADRIAKLRDTLGELEAFSYSIAHDMRAPLRAMQGFGRILVEEYSAALDADGKEYLRRIISSAERLDRLIQDVLNYSKIVRGAIPMEPVQIESLLREVIDSYPNLQRSGARIEMKGPFPPVIANPASLTQVISNLLGNAVKFVDRGVKPEIRVRAEEEQRTASSSGADRWVKLWFEDNGIGIDKDSQARIFDMFQRLNRPELYEGTGMGLAIVRKAVERMGGKVGVESEPGKGSRFWVKLKRADVEMSQQAGQKKDKSIDG